VSLTTRKHHTIYIDHGKFKLLAKLSRAIRTPQAPGYLFMAPRRLNIPLVHCPVGYRPVRTV
jgi:hypothetical protein